MIKTDFSKITIQGIDGKPIEADFRKQLGNQLYMQGQNIEECQLGKRIYFAKDNEAIELTQSEADIIRRAVQPYAYVARTAIEQAITPDE